MTDRVKITGSYVIRKNGVVIREGKNLVVNDGLNLIALRLSGSGTAPTKMAVGDDQTQPAAGDTALGNELHRVALTSSVSNNGLTYHAVFTGSNAGPETPAEFGIFNANSGGTMLCRFICDAFAWLAAEVLEVDWTINIGDWG